MSSKAQYLCINLSRGYYVPLLVGVDGRGLVRERARLLRLPPGALPALLPSLSLTCISYQFAVNMFMPNRY